MFCFYTHHRPVTLPSGPLTAPCHCLGLESSKRAFSEPLSVRWHHVMKLAVVTKQVSITESEPRPIAHCSWITSFTDLWQTVWDIVAPFMDPSFSQVVPPRIRNGFQRETWLRAQRLQQTMYVSQVK